MVTVDRCEALKKESGIFGGDHNDENYDNDEEQDEEDEDEDENDNGRI